MLCRIPTIANSLLFSAALRLGEPWSQSGSRILSDAVSPPVFNQLVLADVAASTRMPCRCYDHPAYSLTRLTKGGLKKTIITPS